MVTKKETKFNVSIRYRDGGVDRYHGVKSAGIREGTLEVIESTSTVTYITLDIISYFRIEKEE